jgi:AraC-like DNA-binding protein
VPLRAVCHPATVPEPVWEAVAARPAGPLRAVVAEHHAYRQRGVLPARHLGLPSPWLTLIFTLDEPMHVACHPDPQQAPAHYRALVGGLHTTPAVIAHDGAQSGIQLQVSPLGARALLGVPAGELAGLDIHAADVLGLLGAELPERLRAADSWDARFRLLDDRLGRLLDPDAAPPAPEVRRAWRVLRASGGTARIADVAREVGWSERHLAARFRTEIGLTPKAAARVIRFDRARRLVPRVPGAVVAATCGYADQAHLVREFVAFTGLGPRAWLAAEVGNLQDPDRAAGRDWAS